MTETLILAAIRATSEYEQCAANLNTARVFMGLAKDKDSRKSFESALAAVNEAQHKRSKLESALIDFCREQGVQQSGY